MAVVSPETAFHAPLSVNTDDALRLPAWFRRLVMWLEASVVVLLVTGTLVAVAAIMSAGVAHLLAPEAAWPRWFAVDLERIGRSIGESWQAALLLVVALFYSPVRNFLDNVVEVGPLKRTPPAVPAVERSEGVRGERGA